MSFWGLFSHFQADEQTKQDPSLGHSKPVHISKHWGIDDMKSRGSPFALLQSCDNLNYCQKKQTMIKIKQIM